jgi:ribosomal protein S20
MVHRNDAAEPAVRPSRMTTMTTLRTAGFAGLLVAAALVGGTIIGSVAAGTGPSTKRAEAARAAPSASAPATGARVAEYCADFRKAFAANLGVDESALAPAAKAAAISTIDTAVADGTMTKAAGDRIKTRIESADADGCALLAGRLGAVRAATGAAVGVVRDGLTAAAKALAMTPAELGGRLKAGETLRDVATANGVPFETVSAAVTASVKTDLDAAVAAGTIRQARADRILQRLERALASGRLRGAPASPAPGS